MHIKFIKDYEYYKKDTIVKKNNAFAKKVVKEGCAVLIPASFRIDNLYVAQIIKPTDFSGQHSIGEVKHIGIFTKETVEEYGKKKTKYIHILTRKEYKTNSVYYYGCVQDLVVNEGTAIEFANVYRSEIKEHKWTNSTRLSIQDIKERENELNGVKTKQNNGRDC